MSTKATALLLWRYIVIVMVFVALVFAALDIAQPFHSGDPGFAYKLGGAPHAVVALRVEPGSEADRAGIRPGMLVTLPGSYFDVATVRAGGRIDVVVNGNARTIRAGSRTRSWFGVEWGVIRLISLAIAVVVLVSQPARVPALALATFLAGTGHLNDWPAYPPALAAIAAASRTFGMIVGFPMFVVFCSGVAGQHGRFERFARGVALTGGVLYALVRLAELVLYHWSVNLDAVAVTATAMEVLFFFTGLTVLADQLRRADGNDRQRVLWVLATLGVSISGGVIYLLFADVIGILPGVEYAALTMALLPVGLGYAILRHKMLDISFAVSQALVYGCITFVIVMVFGLIEWGTSHLVEQYTHGVAVTVNAIAAVTLFAVIRWLHDSLEDLVGSLFFRRRQARLASLEAFAQDLGFVTDAAPLPQLIVDALDRYLGIGGSAVYIIDGDSSVVLRAGSLRGTAPVVSVNDAGVLRLRACRGRVDLNRLSTSLPGSYGFPMIGGANLTGIIVTTAAAGEASLAPDETRVVERIATAASFALDALLIADLRRALSAYAPATG